MAEIELTIKAISAADLRDTVSQLAKAYSASPDDHEPVAAEEPQETGEEKAKRTRRTKAQIEADSAAQNATENSTMSGSATGVQQGSQANSASTQQQSSSASGAGEKGVDPFADQIKRSADEPGLTQVQVRAAATKFMGSHTAKELQAILQEHGDAPNIGAVDPSKYAAVVAALEAAG